LPEEKRIECISLLEATKDYANEVSSIGFLDELFVVYMSDEKSYAFN
jgi:hypothetical protein